MITLYIQLRSKIEMPFEEAKDYITQNFLASAGSLTTCNPEEGTIQIQLNQEELSPEQRHWLSTDTFAAVYIDGYTIEKKARFQRYRTWLPLTLAFDLLAKSPEEAESYLLHKSFEIVTMLHRELESSGLIEVQVAKSESEER